MSNIQIGQGNIIKNSVISSNSGVVVIGNEVVINGAPVGWFKHADIEHQEAAESCEYCDDFHCFRAT